MTMEIQRLGYQPQALYRLDLEVFSVADLRLRAKEELRLTHRYEFHTVVCVTRGTCTQMVDFQSVTCAPGSLLVVRAGQAHNYGPDEDWDGWNLLFRPEFALPVSTTSHDLKLALDLERLPEHMVLSDQELGKVTDLLQQMREDTLLDAPQEHVHALLRHQLHTLLPLEILQGRRKRRHRWCRLRRNASSGFSNWWTSASRNGTRWPTTPTNLATPKEPGARSGRGGRHNRQSLHRSAYQSGSEAPAGAFGPARCHHRR